MKLAFRMTVIALLVAAPWAAAYSFPFGISLRGGAGIGYYSMSELNAHLRIVNRAYDVRIPELGSGINVMLQGRLWLFDFAAASAGYEHFWGETEIDPEEGSQITYKAPADIYTIGGAVRVFEVEDVTDINLGLNVCYARTTFGTNLLNPRRLSEFKGDNWGFELFAEAATNFLNPVEVAFQMGYRGLTVGSFVDKFDDPGFFPDSATEIEVEYSGFFFYICAGMRI
jgi:hypothetical protein